MSLLEVEEDLGTIMLEDENHPFWTDPDFLKLVTVTLGEHFITGMRLTKMTLKEIETVLLKAKSEEEEEDTATSFQVSFIALKLLISCMTIYIYQSASEIV